VRASLTIPRSLPSTLPCGNAGLSNADIDINKPTLYSFSVCEEKIRRTGEGSDDHTKREGIMFTLASGVEEVKHS
jgi:hypothetical protein